VAVAATRSVSGLWISTAPLDEKRKRREAASSRQHEVSICRLVHALTVRELERLLPDADPDRRGVDVLHCPTYLPLLHEREGAELV
jgi:hypothetical protein